MKVQASLAIALIASTSLVSAEPVFMPQATSILKSKQIEAGVGGHFGYQVSEITGSAGTTYKNRVWQIPVFTRYGVSENIEAKLVVPVVIAVDSSEGLSSTRNKNSGLGNIQLGSKWNFLKGRLPLAAALDVDLPTANSRNNRGALGQRYSTQLQQGFNTHIQLVADIPLIDQRLTGHTQLGYMNTATYTTSSDIRFNPSDLFTFGASLDLRLPWISENLSVSAEMVGNTGLNHSYSNSTRNGNDLGTVIEAGPALRYQTGAVRTYAGFLADAGKSTFRAYNYRVNFGASILFGGR